MIVGSDVPREVGKICIAKTASTDHNSVRYPPQPFYVIREATREEWVADVIANGGDPFCPIDYPYYYEVSMD